MINNCITLKNMEKILLNTYFKEVKVDTSNLKNMVVLKNFPSNIIEEAIVVLKQGSKIKNIQKIQNKENIKQNANNKKVGKEKDYIIKEAEMLINQYVAKIENQKKDKKKNQKFESKYFKLRKFTIAITILAIVELISFIIVVI